MNKFKAGDKVVCVDNSHGTQLLKVGKEYTVVCCDHNHVSVYNDYGTLQTFWHSRFEIKEQELPESFYITIKDESHSRLVQEWLSEQGYRWKDTGASYFPVSNGIQIQGRKNMTLTFRNKLLCPNIPEVIPTIGDVVVKKVVSWETQPPVTVTLNGTTYTVNDLEVLEDAVRKLKGEL